jgi:hypothetical protein
MSPCFEVRGIAANGEAISRILDTESEVSRWVEVATNSGVTGITCLDHSTNRTVTVSSDGRIAGDGRNGFRSPDVDAVEKRRGGRRKATYSCKVTGCERTDRMVMGFCKLHYDRHKRGQLDVDGRALRSLNSGGARPRGDGGLPPPQGLIDADGEGIYRPPAQPALVGELIGRPVDGRPEVAIGRSLASSIVRVVVHVPLPVALKLEALGPTLEDAIIDVLDEFAS